jgi:hypothetical protein
MVERLADTMREVERRREHRGRAHVRLRRRDPERTTRSSSSFGIPDVNRVPPLGKALRPGAFEAAGASTGTVTTDLILGLDPVDTPITDSRHVRIRTERPTCVVHPDPETLHELTWRQGWKVCLATPSWPDGRPCELSSRETYRRVLEGMQTHGYEVMAAIEY